MNNEYGYARVSTREQNLARQLDALHEFGLSDSQIFTDKASGATFERKGYKRLLRRLKRGDILVIKSIDRLGRDYEEILEQWRLLTSKRGVVMVVLDMPLLDMRTAQGDLAGKFLAKMMLQLMSYMAQVERDNIRQRQAEGIASAHARGVVLGRPKIKRPENYDNVIGRFLDGEIIRAQAAQELGVSESTITRWVSTDRKAG